MERTMTMPEYIEWMDFYIAEPWGCQVDDGRFGLLAGIIVQALGGDVPDEGFFPRTLTEVKTKRAQAKMSKGRLLFEQIKVACMEHNARLETRLS